MLYFAPIPTTIYERMEWILTALMHAIAQRQPHCWTVLRIGGQLCLRVQKVRNRVLRLMKLVQAGKIRAWARRLAAVAARREMSEAARQRLGKLSKDFAGVKRGKGWLLPLVPSDAATLASQLAHLLGEAEMRRLMAAEPRIGRALRPLFRMLGMDPQLLEVTAADVEVAPMVEPPAAPEPVAPAPVPVSEPAIVPSQRQEWTQ